MPLLLYFFFHSRALSLSPEFVYIDLPKALYRPNVNRKLKIYVHLCLKISTASSMYCLQYELEKHFTSEERKKQQTECFERREKRGKKIRLNMKRKYKLSQRNLCTKFLIRCAVFSNYVPEHEHWNNIRLCHSIP